MGAGNSHVRTNVNSVPDDVLMEALAKPPSARSADDCQALADMLASKGIYFLEQFPMSMRIELCKRFTAERFPRATVVMKEGDTGDSMWLICSGRVKLFRNTKSYTEGETSEYGELLCSLSAGYAVGEQALLEPDAKRSATVVTAKPSLLLKLDERSFQEVFSLDGLMNPQDVIWSQQIDSPESDKVVLDELYRLTDGSVWHSRLGWGTDTPMNSWYGVTMNKYDRVIGLELRDNDLSGRVPVKLGRLKQLRWLQLGNNTKLRGPIPRELGNLDQLEQLDFHNCSGLTGPIPKEIGNLTQLKQLSFHCCQGLTGHLPDSLGNLTNLEELDLYQCSGVFGGIPPSFSELKKLSRLILRSGVACSLNGTTLDSAGLFEDDNHTFYTIATQQTLDSALSYNPFDVFDQEEASAS